MRLLVWVMIALAAEALDGGEWRHGEVTDGRAAAAAVRLL